MKKSCFGMILLYLVLAAVIGWIVQRRMPSEPGAIWTGVIGGFFAWLGAAYLIGIPRKLREAAMIRRGRSGGIPEDGRRNAIFGRIAPNGNPLISPLTRTPCVAYQYEIRYVRGKQDRKLFDGFALTPSTIQGPQGMVRLLAYPKLEVSANYMKVGEQEIRNAEEYIETTEFREVKLSNLRDAYGEMMKVFNDDDGSIRTDMRLTTDLSELRRATFVEWLIEPGPQVCAIGHYSAQRGALVPDPESPLDQVTITTGEPIGLGKLGSAFGYLIGGLLLLGAVTAALTIFYAIVPLSAAEQLSPGMNPTWPEIRVEHFLDRRLRPLMRPRGYLDQGIITVNVPDGTASGRIKDGDHESVLSQSEASQSDRYTTVTLDHGAIVLTVDKGNQPLLLRIAGHDIAPDDMSTSLDLEITEHGAEEIAGRLTYVANDRSGPACHATFLTSIGGKRGD